MKKVLFICAANVARSQIAEAFYNHYTNTTHATSAGVLDFTPAKYVSPICEVVTVMQEEGIDVSEKRVKYIEESMLEGIDSVYILCPEEHIPDFVWKHPHVTMWNITDPFGNSLDTFRMVRDEVKEKVKEII